VERAPTAIELFAEGPHLATANFEIGDPDLDQESATSLEGSARFDNGRFRFEVNVYGMDFSNYIALVERGDVWWADEDIPDEGFAADEASAPVGADIILPVFNFVQQDANFVGGEISAAARLFEAGGVTFRADAALDLVRAEFDGGGHPPRIPPRSLTLGLEAENEQWSGRVEAVDTGEQDRLAPLETETDGFTFFNASLAWRPQGNTSAWTVRLDGRNLTDELGRVHSSFLKDELPLPGRNVRLTLIADF
jgi:iron complex outermembrane receptor protein